MQEHEPTAAEYQLAAAVGAPDAVDRCPTPIIGTPEQCDAAECQLARGKPAVICYFADADDFPVGTTDEQKIAALDRAAERAPTDWARHRYRQRAARIVRRHLRCADRGRHRRAHRPRRLRRATRRRSSGSDPPPDEPPAAQPRGILQALHDATPGLSGAERLRIFLAFPLRVQQAACTELAEQVQR